MGNFIKIGLSTKGENRLNMLVSGYKYVLGHGVQPLFYSLILPYLRRREALIFQRGNPLGQKVALSGATKKLYAKRGINRRRALEPRGELYDSLMGRGKNRVEYISPLRLTYGTKYRPGYFIQHGARIKTTSKMMAWFWAQGLPKSARDIRIPPRPFLYIDNKLLADIRIMSTEFFDKMNKHLLYYEPIGPFRWLPR